LNILWLTQKVAIVTRIKTTKYFGTFFIKWKIWQFLPFLSQVEHRYFLFKKHGISECKLGFDIAKSFNPKIS